MAVFQYNITRHINKKQNKAKKIKNHYHEAKEKD